MIPSCPNCYSNDWVQSAQAIYGGAAVNASSENNRVRFDKGGYAGGETSSQGMNQRLSPPTGMSLGQTVLAIVGAPIIGIFVIGIFASAAYLSAWVQWFLFSLWMLAAVVGAIMEHLEFRSKLALWRRLWYCQLCCVEFYAK